ncbi:MULTISPECIES: hypothetical protein [Prauserella salsuginis group]|uniref:Uncharacterized protein n=1 Tax=Prauserella salsuginis TaxID=387889 RepID=A0ABW6G2B8_9PSEU|nr:MULTISPECIES: hypothetical protein [Prauserella salsuginis group]
MSVLTICAALTGCTGLPDRDQEVERLETELGSMSGVDDVSTIYSNDFTAGARLTLELTVETASEDELANLARRINDLKQDHFEGYTQTTEFLVAPRTTASFGATPEPAQVAERAQQLRNVRAAVPGTEINWSRTELALRDSPTATTSLAAVRSEFADERIQATVIARDDSPVWTVAFPFRLPDEKRIRDRLSGFHSEVSSVTVEDGALTALTVEVRSPRSAREELDAIIDATQPTPERPLMLDWHAPEPEDAPREFSGAVHVAACNYPNSAGEENPRDHYTAEAIELQRQLRAEYDTCR